MRILLGIGLVFTCIIGLGGLYLFKSWNKQTDPLLVVLLMVKNEADVMRGTLEPFLKAGVDAYLILDTGSTDDTVSVTKKLFEEYGVKYGYIEEKPFVDFATSRNHAIQYAEQYFPHAGYFLMIDAEWYTEDVPGLLEFCREYNLFEDDSFLISLFINNKGFNFYVPRLFKPHRNIRFEGVVHEVINKGGWIKVPEKTCFRYEPKDNGCKKTARRWVRDKELLLKEAECKQNDARTLFYLGQTCDCLGDWNDAITWYKKRCLIKSWDEEDFMAHYRLAQVYERLNMYDQAIFYFMKAYTLKPTRAEPLVRLAQHYVRQRDYQQGYVFARCAVEMPYPKHDTLFLEKDFYDYYRHEILARVAQYVGEYEIGKESAIKALRHSPNMSHLQRLLDFYDQKIIS